MSMWVSDDNEDDRDDDWEEGPPFADPAIRAEFEAALGCFILAFNELDFCVGRILLGEAAKTGKTDLLKHIQYTSERITALQLMAKPDDHLSDIPFARIRAIAKMRNDLAHGYFSQNPFDGSYEIVLKAQRKNYPTASILATKSELDDIARLLKGLWAFHGYPLVLD